MKDKLSNLSQISTSAVLKRIIVLVQKRFCYAIEVFLKALFATETSQHILWVHSNQCRWRYANAFKKSMQGLLLDKLIMRVSIYNFSLFLEVNKELLRLCWSIKETQISKCTASIHSCTKETSCTSYYFEFDIIQGSHCKSMIDT